MLVILLWVDLLHGIGHGMAELVGRSGADHLVPVVVIALLGVAAHALGHVVEDIVVIHGQFASYLLCELDRHLVGAFVVIGLRQLVARLVKGHHLQGFVRESVGHALRKRREQFLQVGLGNGGLHFHAQALFVAHHRIGDVLAV